jgi:molybdate transport system substrate-binding protein
MVTRWRLRKRLAALTLSFIAGFLALPACAAAGAEDRVIRVAAAADLNFAMVELVRTFEQQNAVKVEATYGSSGNFFSQIQNGAPFDLFFSADVDYPKRLAAAGLADSETLYEYAVGRIVIWTPRNAKVDVAREGWKVLLDERVQKIAIANPQHAPYGRAAVAAMQKAGIYEQAKAKLVYGENISQAAQFAQSGNAQAGIVALSLSVSPAMKDGKSWIIPADMHAPIRQAAVVLRAASDKDGAAAFLKFVKSAAGREILERLGFQSAAVDGH